VLWAQRHSAAMPLLLVLVVPVVGLVFVLRRRRQQRELRRIFEATLVARGRSAIAAYRAEPAPISEAAPVVEERALADREFASAREFALAAVVDAGYPPNLVARVLHVPTSRVREWVDDLDQETGAGEESTGDRPGPAAPSG
jgi:hypothetical protein